ncbi:hypothetical protein HY844_02965 [Candidatus Berkelbacteria bacterium]|nr:hypothetical protein [Candidatus Berkelbacteria bacterium]
MERKFSRSPNLYYTGRTTQPKKIQKSDKNLKPLIVLLFFVVIIFFISRLSLFPVKYVQVNEVYVKPSLEKLIGLGLFSRELSYKISNISKTDPVVKKINCSKGLPDTISCEAQLRSISGYWKTDQEIFAFDNDGFIFSQIKELPKSKYLLIIDTAKQKVKIGDEVATQLIISFYNEVMTEADKKGIVFDGFSIKQTYYQFSINVTEVGKKKLENPITILMTTSYPASSQITVAEQLINKNSKSSISQIDVRVPGYGYVK